MHGRFQESQGEKGIPSRGNAARPTEAGKSRVPQEKGQESAPPERRNELADSGAGEREATG